MCRSWTRDSRTIWERDVKSILAQLDKTDAKIHIGTQNDFLIDESLTEDQITFAIATFQKNIAVAIGRIWIGSEFDHHQQWPETIFGLYHSQKIKKKHLIVFLVLIFKSFQIIFKRFMFVRVVVTRIIRLPHGKQLFVTRTNLAQGFPRDEAKILLHHWWKRTN